MSQDHQWERVILQVKLQILASVRGGDWCLKITNGKVILQVKLQTLASAEGGDWCLGKSDSAGKTTATGLS